MGQQDKQPGLSVATAGLRDRKKAKRRQVILREAAKLFADQGIEATTMAAIADSAGVSPPTVFNYFGSKDNLLSSLIFEGSEASHARFRNADYRADRGLTEILAAFLRGVSENTLKIAGKRVWRYSEAAQIRRPNTEFEERFALLDNRLINELARVLASNHLVLRNGRKPDHRFLAKLFFDRWTAHYLKFIKDDAMTLDSHCVDLQADIAVMVDLMFVEPADR